MSEHSHDSKEQAVLPDREQTSKRILAAIFAMLVMLIALVPIRMTMIQTREFLDNYTKDIKTDLVSYTKVIEDAYQNILTHTSPLPVINRGSYISFNGYMANMLGLKNFNNVIKLNNGHLGLAKNLRDVTRDVLQITRLSKYIKEKQGDFLWVIGPSQFSVSGGELPAGYKDFTNDIADAQISGAKNNAVPFLDLRKRMQEQDLITTDVMFRTDHHWNVRAGFWGYAQIIEELIRGNIIQKDDMITTLTDLENYHVETLHKVFLGSYGRRTGVYFNGIDDFDIFNPKFDTNLTVTLFPSNRQKSGSFYEVCYSGYYDPKQTPSPASHGGVWEHTYGYWGEAQQGSQYHNSKAPINKRVLMLSDSFGSFPNAFFALTFTDFAQVYINRYKWAETNLEEFIMNYDPELIILLTESGSEEIGKYNYLPSYQTEVK